MKECCKREKERPVEEKKNIINRLNRVIGQLEGIKKMISDDRYCEDVLIQLSASEKAIKNISAIIFESHVKTCIVDNIKNGNDESIDEVVELFKRFI